VTSVAITGVSGFVGRWLAAKLIDSQYVVRGIVRSQSRRSETPFETEVTGDIDGKTDWVRALRGVDVVIHLAARTHTALDHAGKDLWQFRPLNVDGTRSLAEAAARAGVRRLLFLSSIKVNGEETAHRPFRSSDTPAPEDAYGVSKWEAEGALAVIAHATGLEVVIVRSPMVYGPGAKGNFPRLVRSVHRGVPLPLRSIRNRRSLVGIDNLVDLLVHCVPHSAAAGQTFLVSDGHDVSTPDLIRGIARALGVKPRLIPLPTSILRIAGRALGREAEVRRMVGSLQVDIEHTRSTLGWKPPYSFDHGLRRAVGAA
jgi:nucleoside-diphosphate-sugar epimerase